MTQSDAVNPEWLREALVAGFDHEAVPYQEGTIATGMANSRRAAPGGPELLPHQSMLKAYFIARAYATAKRAGRQHNPGSISPWFRLSFNAWLQDLKDNPVAGDDSPTARKTFPKRHTEQPPQGEPNFSYELAEALTLAIIGGYEDEGQLDPHAATQRMKVMIPYLGENPPPYALLITGYFQARAAAIAQRLGRDPYEEPDRWFAQAANNYLESVTLSLPTQ